MDSISNLPKVKMQLVGLDGNAFSILGRFTSAAKQQGWDKDSIAKVTETAMSGDYNNLLRTIMANIDDSDFEYDGEDDDDYDTDYNNDYYGDDNEY